ncbi:putative Protein of unknown function (DUF667) [Trypanosoma vivax]|uniref:Uncharacterized protein n=1 Tax=Trypanosoma vivax (strain Y486) TaxID=1055687 RepID=G0TZB0_TRYVY|nr:putative Protein of unknown function (DUF667) [Trypanosoma vivax]CCC49313.1 conserved hypothetical protein [Trypanosoma vivax Y486]
MSSCTPAVAAAVDTTVPSYVLYSPQGSKPLAPLHVTGATVSCCYDRGTKSQLLRIPPSTHVSFLRPSSSLCVGINGGAANGRGDRNTSAAAAQRVIVLQLCCENSARSAFSLTIELLLQDKLGRRRLIFSNCFDKLQQCSQHVKVPLRCVVPGTWSNIVFDVPRIHLTLFGGSGGHISDSELVGSRKLLQITLSCSSVCRLRRLLGMSHLPLAVENGMTHLEKVSLGSLAEEVEWPPSLRLPAEVPVRWYIIRTCTEELLYEPQTELSPDVQMGSVGPSKNVPPSPFELVSECDPGAAADEVRDPHSLRMKHRLQPVKKNPRCSSNGALAPQSCFVGDVKQYSVRDPRACNVVSNGQIDLEERFAVGEVEKSSLAGVSRRAATVNAPSNNSRSQLHQVSAPGRGSDEGGMLSREDVSRSECTAASSPSTYNERGRTFNTDRTSSALNLLATFESGNGRLGASLSVEDCQNSLEVMRGRVKCIQALMREGVVYSGGNCMTDKGSEKLMGGEIGIKNDPDQLYCDASVRGSEVQYSAKKQCLPCTETDSIQLLVDGCERDEGRGQVAPPSGNCHPTTPSCTTCDVTVDVASSPAVPTAKSDKMNPYCGKGETSETCAVDEDEERFTVNICMSTTCGRPAVVVPAEKTPKMDMKPPVPPSSAHQVDRLCFDSVSVTPSKVLFNDDDEQSVPLWTSRGATPRAEEDTPVISYLASPVRMVNAGEKVPLHAHRHGRLGGLCVLQQLSRPARQALETSLQSTLSQLIEFCPQPATGGAVGSANTPLNSFRCGNSVGGESSVSVIDYRRAPGEVAEAASRQFVVLDSSRGGVEEEDISHRNCDGNKMYSGHHRVKGTQSTPLPPLSPEHANSSRLHKNGAELLFNEDAVDSVESSHSPMGNSEGQKVTTQKGGYTSLDNLSLPMAVVSGVLPSQLEHEGLKLDVESPNDALVFDPLLQCCLDLRSNTYVMAASRSYKAV